MERWNTLSDHLIISEAHWIELDAFELKKTRWDLLRLRNFLQTSELSQTNLAMLLELNQSTISAWVKRSKEQPDQLLPEKYWSILNQYERDPLQYAVSNANGRPADILLHLLPGYTIAKLLATAVTKPRNDGISPTYSNPTPLGGDERECPKCAEIIKIRAVYCKHCHSDIPKG